MELERELGLVGRSAALGRELDRSARSGAAPKPEPLPEALAPAVAGLKKLVAQGRGHGRRGGEAVP